MQLQIKNLSKKYRQRKLAVDNISLSLANGMFGLLGPNGAGKSTLMKMLAALLEPMGGTVTYDRLRLGEDNQAIRRLLGYLPQDYGLHDSLTACELLNYMATLHGHPDGANRHKRVDAMLEQVNLTDAATQKVGGFSGGMRQRLGIAQALLNDPALLIVDEPTAGLDPEERVRFRNLLGRLSKDRIVILSTHIVGDISSSCDDMALLENDRIRFRGQTAALIERVQGRVWQTTVSPAQVADIEEDHNVVSTVRRSAGVTLRVLGVAEIVQGLPRLQPEEPTLEDAYIWAMSYPHAEAIA